MADSPHPVDVYVGGRLRARRQKLRVTQSELGRRLGLSAQQVQKYENGMNRVSASKLFDMAAALNTGVAWFFEGLAYPKTDEALAAPTLADAPSSHQATRELIAAYKALPSDKARTEALAALKAQAATGI